MQTASLGHKNGIFTLHFKQLRRNCLKPTLNLNVVVMFPNTPMSPVEVMRINNSILLEKPVGSEQMSGQVICQIFLLAEN